MTTQTWQPVSCEVGSHTAFEFAVICMAVTHSHELRTELGQCPVAITPWLIQQ